MKFYLLSLGALLFMNTSLEASPQKATSIYNFAVTTLTGEKLSLETYAGKVLLIVNTASECGYTPQYKGLQAVYEKYKAQGFEVLGFPSNDFGLQEPGTNAEIKKFCEMKYKTTFPMFEKGPVTGNKRQPLYAYLSDHAENRGAVSWNFEKFLISRDGKIIGRFKSKITPEDSTLVEAIEAALKEKATK